MNWLKRVKRYLPFPPQERGEFEVFETEFGIKYVNGTFSSNQFNTYPICKKVQLNDLSDPVSSLVCPPDLLKDPYTWSGVSILKSPHYELMEEMKTKRLSSSNKYLFHSSQGTLDARQPDQLRMRRVRKKYFHRKKELENGTQFVIKVLELSQAGVSKNVLIDGKHRLALALSTGMTQNIVLHFLPNTFAYDPFFKQIFSKVLDMPFDQYSKNQQIIREIYDKS